MDFTQGSDMIGQWQASYVEMRLILHKLNVYFLPVIITFGEYLGWGLLTLKLICGVRADPRQLQTLVAP